MTANILTKVFGKVVLNVKIIRDRDFSKVYRKNSLQSGLDNILIIFKSGEKKTYSPAEIICLSNKYIISKIKVLDIHINDRKHTYSSGGIEYTSRDEVKAVLGFIREMSKGLIIFDDI